MVGIVTRNVARPRASELLWMMHCTAQFAMLPCLFFLAQPINAQNLITPWAGSVLADGTISPGEWDAAPRIAVAAGSGDSCLVALAADTWGVYFAFMGNLESNTRFPEVLLDPAHDRTPAWNMDDHWFHVSATNCHHQGAYGVYDDCSPLPSYWSAHPSFVAGPPDTDSVEVAIPWYMLGITPAPGDSVGLGLVLTNTSTVWDLWPAGADRDTPGTWGHLIFPGASGVGEHSVTAGLRAFPVPASGELHVAWDPQAGIPDHIQVLDAQGRLVVPRSVSSSSEMLVRDLPAGVCQIVLTWPSGLRDHCKATIMSR